MTWRVFTQYRKQRRGPASDEVRDSLVFDRLAGGATFIEVSRDLGVSFQRVSQIFKRACAARGIQWRGRGTTEAIRRKAVSDKGHLADLSDFDRKDCPACSSVEGIRRQHPYRAAEGEGPPAGSINWTTARPGQEGWYWWRAGPKDDRPQCVEVLADESGELRAALRLRVASVRTWGGEWWPEPIPAPHFDEGSDLVSPEDLQAVRAKK